jgi:hypothetical protein
MGKLKIPAQIAEARVFPSVDLKVGVASGRVTLHHNIYIVLLQSPNSHEYQGRKL